MTTTMTSARPVESPCDFEERVPGLVARLLACGSDDARRAEVRAELISTCMPMARYLARRYRNRGESLDDLVQVATVGLIKAVDGFDPGRGTTFGAYAVPTIIGEIKRYFRDKGWAIRVPRRLQELHLQIVNVVDPLTQRLGRAPTVTELAERLGTSEEHVIEGLACAPAYRALSLQAPAGADPEGATLADLLGTADPELEQVERREALRPLIAKLPVREQRIIAMRYFGNMTQSQIAAATGISQMHVSRLLGHSLRVLREELLAG